MAVAAGAASPGGRPVKEAAAAEAVTVTAVAAAVVAVLVTVAAVVVAVTAAVVAVALAVERWRRRWRRWRRWRRRRRRRWFTKTRPNPVRVPVQSGSIAEGTVPPRRLQSNTRAAAYCRLQSTVRTPPETDQRPTTEAD